MKVSRRAASERRNALHHLRRSSVVLRRTDRPVPSDAARGARRTIGSPRRILRQSSTQRSVVEGVFTISLAKREAVLLQFGRHVIVLVELQSACLFVRVWIGGGAPHFLPHSWTSCDLCTEHVDELVFVWTHSGMTTFAARRASDLEGLVAQDQTFIGTPLVWMILQA